MTQIQPFTFPETGDSLRTLLADGEAFVCHADVCRLLQHSNPSVAIRLVDEDDKRLIDLSETDIPALKRDATGNARTWFLTESGFYTLALASNAPGAQRLRRWVTKEVIPSIRKTGFYALTQPTRKDLALMVIEVEEALEAEKERADRAEFQVLELAPAARAWDELMEAHGDYDVAQAAQILARDPSIQTGRDRLFDYMDAIRWTYKNGKSPRRAYQTQVDLGRLRMAPTHYDHPRTGDRMLGAPKVVVTVKGLFELHKRLGGTAQLDALLSEEVSV
jgi:prophage antirepressor-like protein